MKGQQFYFRQTVFKKPNGNPGYGLRDGRLILKHVKDVSDTWSRKSWDEKKKDSKNGYNFSVCTKFCKMLQGTGSKFTKLLKTDW